MVRRIKETDFNSIRNLVVQVHKLHVENRPDIYNDIDPFDINYFNYLLNDLNTITLVYELDNLIIAYCVVKLREPSKNPLLKSRKIAFIEDLCVDINHRKTGIGKLLFEEMKIISKEKGADSMELMVWSFNETAIEFYKNMGMTHRSYIMEEKL